MSGFPGSAAEHVAVAQVTTGTASSTPLASTAVNMKNFGKALVIFCLGDMASETIDCVVETCASNGSSNVALKSATQLSAHASNNDSKQIVIAVENNECGPSGQTYIRGKITTGNVTGGTCSIIVLGLEPRQGVAGDNDNATVVEVKN